VNAKKTETMLEHWYYEEVPTQPSIWTHPVVVHALPHSHRTTIENTVKNLAQDRDYLRNPFAQASGGVELVACNVFDVLINGVGVFDHNKPTIRRVQSFSSAADSDSPLTISLVVWSRLALIREFSVPDHFQPKIPVDPSFTPPPGSTWGWRKGPQSSGFNRETGRHEEVATFEGGFWGRGLHTFIV